MTEQELAHNVDKTFPHRRMSHKPKPESTTASNLLIIAGAAIVLSLLVLISTTDVPAQTKDQHQSSECGNA